MADDPALLNLAADHEAGHVLQEQEWNPKGVAEVYKARCLVR